MTSKDIWDCRCHDSVSWDQVVKNTEHADTISPSDPYQDPADASHAVDKLNDTMVEILELLRRPVLRIRAKLGMPGTVYTEVEGQTHLPEFEPSGRSSRDDLPDYSDLKDLCSFLIEANYFTGYREEGVGSSKHDRRSLKRMTDKIVPIIEEGEGITTTNSGPSNHDLSDFNGNVVSYGGPVTNWYIRKLMYGNEINLPYKIRLNPRTFDKDLSGWSPEKLRKARDPNGRPPNWHIADKSGEQAIFETDDGEQDIAVPEPDDRGERWEKDYFMIIRTENLHPGGNRYGEVLALVGCHGLGTAGAALALQNRNVVEELAGFGHEYFQAIGYVARADPNSTVLPTKYDDLGILAVEDI